ncbi:MAG: GspE/PulE family protein [Clostridium sp.]|nr:GspE/PulE family protein [Clostridium sp.]
MIIIREYSISDIDLKTAKSLNKEICGKYKIIPLREDEKKVYILTYEEDNISEYINFLYEKEIVIEKISESNYSKLINSVFGEDDREIEEAIIYNAIECRASDIHFEPMESHVTIRYRINGGLCLANKIERDLYTRLCSKIKIKSGMDITEKRKPQDGKFILRYKNIKYDLRISSIPVIYGEKLVIRILYCDNFDYKLEDLGFDEGQIDIIRKIINLNTGLVVVNGPTGSGKSTTLYTILKELDSKAINITTLEDPVEVYLANINQVSLNRKAGVTFSSGLRSILRQDPDVIMVGEIRDEETADIAVRASITGHKVYTTIHAKSPREVYLRLENMGVKNYLLKDALCGVISQRLIKVLCKKCREEDIENSKKGKIIYKKCGCRSCNYTGYEGRKIVSSAYFLSMKDRENLKNIYNNTSYLGNEGMRKNLEALLYDGSISFDDYNKFIEGELAYE